MAGVLVLSVAFPGLAYAGSTVSHFSHYVDKIRKWTHVLVAEAPPAWVRDSPKARELREKGTLVFENTTRYEYVKQYGKLLRVNPTELRIRGEGNCLSCAIAGVRTLVGKRTQAEPKKWDDSVGVGPMLIEHGLTRPEKLKSFEAALKRMRSAPPGAKFLMTFEDVKPDGVRLLVEKPGHVFIGVREGRELRVIDTQVNGFGSVLDRSVLEDHRPVPPDQQHEEAKRLRDRHRAMRQYNGDMKRHNEVSLYRVDKGIRFPRIEIDTDPGKWTSGDDARDNFELVVAGRTGDHGYIKAKLNGNSVSYFVEKTVFDLKKSGRTLPGTRIIQLKDKNLTWKEIEEVFSAEDWRTWSKLTDLQFKLVPHQYGPTLETRPLDAQSPDVGSPDVGSPDVGSPDVGSPDGRHRYADRLRRVVDSLRRGVWRLARALGLV